MNDFIWKSMVDRLFEVICSSTNIYARAENVDLSPFVSSIITHDDVKMMLFEIVENDLIKDVIIDSEGKLSCQITTIGLQKFHEAVTY